MHAFESCSISDVNLHQAPLEMCLLLRDELDQFLLLLANTTVAKNDAGHQQKFPWGLDKIPAGLRMHASCFRGICKVKCGTSNKIGCPMQSTDIRLYVK